MRKNREDCHSEADTYSTARALLEDDVVRENKELVNKLSDGRLGYLHVERMMWSEFQKFEREIYAEVMGKKGLSLMLEIMEVVLQLIIY